MSGKYIKNGVLNSIFKVASSNLMVLVLGMVVTFLLPMKLSTEGFGHWQLFVLYTSYCGFFIFGFSDGINLRYAGKQYEELDFKLFRMNLRIITIFTTIIAIVLSVFAISSNVGMDMKIIYLGFSINIILFNVKGYFIHVSGMIGRFKEYSIGITIERVVLVVFIILTFFIPSNAYYIYIFGDMLAKIITIGYFINNYKEIVFGQACKFKNVKVEVIKNVKVGFFIMISAIFSMMMLNYVKFFIEMNFGIKEFSYFSFAVSMLSLALQFMLSISTVLYPMMRRVNEKSLEEIYMCIRKILNKISWILLVFYYFAVIFIKIIIPKYSEVIDFLFVLFPLVIFNIKNTMVITLFLKVYRKEKIIFKNNILGLCVIILMIAVGYKITSSIEMVSLMYLGAYIITTSYAESKLINCAKWNMKNNFIEIIITAVFILINYKLGFVTSFVVFGTIAVIINILGVKETIKSIKLLSQLLKSDVEKHEEVKNV